MIIAAADGSSLGNPGPSGWAWYIDDKNWAAGGWRNGTNNIGELTAILKLLQALHDSTQDIHFLCDSRYAIDSVTKWRHGWKQRGWRKADGSPVKNQDLMVALDAELEHAKSSGRKISFEWVRGHAGHELNEAADQRAQAVAAAYRDGLALTAQISGPGLNTPVTADENTTTVARAADTTNESSHHDPADTTNAPRADHCDGNTRVFQMGKCEVRDHYFTVPLDHYRDSKNGGDLWSASERIAPLSGVKPARPTDASPIEFAPRTPSDIKIFVREIALNDGVERPYAIYFQGGPGCPGGRATDWESGWVGELTQHFRLLMLDQRGTGASTPLTRNTLAALGQGALEVLKMMRADQIVADAEAIRVALGIDTWTVVGQSFGGFIITAYLSRAPQVITQAFICGGLPGLAPADEIYRQTHNQIAKRNEEFYAQTGLEQRVREIAAHCQDHEEYLPSGERLTPLRFRSIGMNLGRTRGIDALRYLLEDPFVTVCGQRQLSENFLARIHAEVSFAGRPLYALIHETIYAHAIPGVGATRWAADRVRATIAGFALDQDPRDPEQPYYLTGESIGPWTIAADPALAGLTEIADALAVATDWPLLYDPQALRAAQRPVFAAVYPDDVFVPYELSLETARVLGAKVYEFPEYHHDGIRASGTKVIRTLLAGAGLIESAD